MNGSLVALFSSLTIREFRPSLLDCFKYRANRKRRLVPDPRTVMGDEAEVYIYVNLFQFVIISSTTLHCFCNSLSYKLRYFLCFFL